MPLNTKLIGYQFPPGKPYEVARVKIREFAAAIGDYNPAYHDVEAAQALGHRDLIAPPTFAIAVTSSASGSVLSAPDLGLNYSLVVHGEQRFSYSRPITAGDVLVGTARIEDIRAAGGNELLTIVVDLTTPDGEHVCTATMTLVSRGTAPQQEG